MIWETLAADLTAQGWCPRHRVMLVGRPVMSFDAGKQVWQMTAGHSMCPAALAQSECVTSWVWQIEIETLTADEVRERAR